MTEQDKRPDLVSLHDFNAKRMGIFVEQNQPRKNGIACPNCGDELVDSTPNLVLTSNPPQLTVYCPTCDYHDYRVV